MGGPKKQGIKENVGERTDQQRYDDQVQKHKWVDYQ